MFQKLFTLLVSVLKTMKPEQILTLRVSSSTFTTDKRKNVVVDESVQLNPRTLAESLKALCTFVTTNEASSFEVSYPKDKATEYANSAMEIVSLVATMRATDGSLSALPYEYSGKGGQWVGFRVATTPITVDDVASQLSGL